MKKYIISFLLFIISYTVVLAQETDPWIGTWTSESYQMPDLENSSDDNLVYYNAKRVIRITKENNQLSIRMKAILVKDPDDAFYFPPMVVKRIDNNTLYLEANVEKEPDINGGIIDGYSDITYYYTLSLQNGTLHFIHYKFVSVNYSKRMKYVDTKTYDCHNWRGNDLHLFKDDW